MNAERILNMARRRAGLTQRELAARTGVAQPSISKIERGVISPTVDTLERLIRECGMELEPIRVPGEDQVDRTLIWENLKLTSSQRARQAAREWNVLEDFKKRARVVERA
ncbi:MAG: helix-turn-helix domain-containing protein [Actinomycetota bacterium]